MFFREVLENSSKALSSGSRISQLDGLRGLAILMVLTVHVWGYAKGPVFSLWGLWDLSFLPHVALVGVDLFFVLSGYLLFSQAMKRNERPLDMRSYRTFLARRIRRILPAYYLLLLALFLFIPTTSPILRLESRQGWLNLMHHLVFIHNFTGDYVHSFAYMWSLAPEMQFYFIFPALAAFILAVGPGRALLWIWLATALLSVGMQIYSANIPFQVDISLPYRLNQFMTGMCAAYFLPKLQGRFKIPSRSVAAAHLLSWAGILLLGFLMWEGRQRMLGQIRPGPDFWGMTGCYLWSSLIGISFAMLLMGALFEPRSFWGQIWNNRALGFIGIVSYGIFIWHNPILEWISKFRFVSGIASLQARMAILFLSTLLIAGTAAVLSYVFVESPFLRRRRNSCSETSLRGAKAKAIS